MDKTVTTVINQNKITPNHEDNRKKHHNPNDRGDFPPSAEFVNANSATTDTLQITPVEQAAKDDKIGKALLYGLESDLNGILEATFYNTIAYKTMNPAFSSDQLVEKITQIALDENSHVVRYKAFLALSYMKDYDEFSNESEQLRTYVQANDKISAFQVIVDKLQEQQVAANK